MKEHLPSNYYRLKDLLLKTYKEDPSKSLSAEEIFELLPDDFPRHKEHSSKLNSSAYRNLHKAIEALNDDLEIQHIYIVKNNRYKVATKEEAKEYMESYYKKANRMYSRMNVIAKKIGLDRQTRIVFNKEKDIVETF